MYEKLVSPEAMPYPILTKQVSNAYIAGFCDWYLLVKCLVKKRMVSVDGIEGRKMGVGI